MGGHLDGVGVISIACAYVLRGEAGEIALLKLVFGISENGPVGQARQDVVAGVIKTRIHPGDCAGQLQAWQRARPPSAAQFQTVATGAIGIAVESTLVARRGAGFTVNDNLVFHAHREQAGLELKTVKLATQADFEAPAGLGLKARAKAAACRIGKLGERGGLEAGGVLAKGAPPPIQHVAIAQAVAGFVIDALAGVVDTARLQLIVDRHAQAVVSQTDHPAPLLLCDGPGQLQAQAEIARGFALVQRQVIADAASANERFEVNVTAITLAVILLVFQAELHVQQKFAQRALVVQRTADDLPVDLDQAVTRKRQLLTQVPLSQPGLRTKLVIAAAEALHHTQRGDVLVDCFPGIHCAGERGGPGWIALQFAYSQSAGIFGQRIVEVVEDRKPVASTLSIIEPEACVEPFHRALVAITVLFQMGERTAKSP